MSVITKIVISGLKGVSLSLDLPGDKRGVLIGGHVGAGKSTTLDAVRYCLGWPNRLGSIDLKRFGSWWIELTIKGRRFTAGYRNSAIWAIDGQGVPESTFRAEIGQLFRRDDVTDLSSFLQLSDRKRSELLAALIASGQVSIGRIMGDDFRWAKSEHANAPDIAYETSINGLLSAVNEYKNQTNAALRSAQSALLRLAQDPEASELAAIPTLEADLAAQHQRLGTITKALEDADGMRVRAEDLRSALSRLEADIENDTRLASELPIATAELNMTTASELLSRALARKEALDAKKPAGVEDRVDQLDTLYKRAASCSDQTLLEQAPSRWNATAVELRDFIRDFTNDQADEIKAATEEASRLMLQWSKDQAALRTEIQSAESAKRTAEKRLHDRRQIDTQMNGRMQRAALLKSELDSLVVRVDLDSINAELENVKKTIEDLTSRLHAARKIKTLADQKIRTEKEISLLLSIGEQIKGVVQAIESHQRDSVQNVGAGLLATVNARLALLIPGAKLNLASTNTGMSFTLRRVSKSIPYDTSVDDLSDGESVLLAAALLPSLQRGNHRALTLNSEDLNQESLQRLLSALPNLDVDLMMVANNRLGESEIDVTGWHTVMLKNGALA
jgi:hypothetical protein